LNLNSPRCFKDRKVERELLGTTPAIPVANAPESCNDIRRMLAVSDSDGGGGGGGGDVMAGRESYHEQHTQGPRTSFITGFQ
jgi:hypothetical protein